MNAQRNVDGEPQTAIGLAPVDNDVPTNTRLAAPQGPDVHDDVTVFEHLSGLEDSSSRTRWKAPKELTDLVSTGNGCGPLAQEDCIVIVELCQSVHVAILERICKLLIEYAQLVTNSHDHPLKKSVNKVTPNLARVSTGEAKKASLTGGS
jgi:hypothetical protein